MKLQHAPFDKGAASAFMVFVLACLALVFAGMAFTAWLNNKPIPQYIVCHMQHLYTAGFTGRRMERPEEGSFCAEIMAGHMDTPAGLNRVGNNAPWPLNYVFGN